MKTRKAFPLFLIAVLLFSSVPVYATKPQRVNIIIGFAGPSDQSIVTRNGGVVGHVYKTIDAVSAKVSVHVLDRIASSPRVVYIEEDFLVEIQTQTIPWGINRIGSLLAQQTATGTGIQVAIIDTGIDYTHPDLAGNYITGYDWVNDDDDPMDDNSHGTHCAGTIAAIDNSVGVLGVAPTVGLYGLKAISSSGSGYISDIVAAIDWAVLGPDGVKGNTDDADVISMSLGTSIGSMSLKDACDRAYSDGILVVAAAGNSGNSDGKGDNVLYPARYESVLAVAATDSTDSRAYFSSTGPSVELSAPGVNTLSTIPGGSLSYKSGTSMACPHVAGAAALVMSSSPDASSDLDGDGKWSASEVRARLSSTASDLGVNGRDSLYGYGMVDVEKAVGSKYTPPPPPPQVDNVAIASVTCPESAEKDDAVQVTVRIDNSGDTNVMGLQLVLIDQTDSKIIDERAVNIDSRTSLDESFTWDTSSSTIGNHVLRAYHTRPDDIASDNEYSTNVIIVEPTVPEPPSDPPVEPPSPEPPEKIVHVADLDGASMAIGKSGKWRALITIVVHDQDHRPVSGAQVSLSVIGTKTTTLYGVTDAPGSVVLMANNLKESMVTATVLDITLMGYDYMPSENHDPELDSDGTSIVLLK